MPEVTLEEKIEFLGSPATYGLAAHEPVLAEETHMSWIFLAGPYVYKLKKPVRYPYLDFSTLAAREHNCREEVRLNRRLAAEIYLGMLPLTLDRSSELALGGDGQPVDWLVWMRRLPWADMLDQAIVNRSARPGHIIAVADRLTDFYLQSSPVSLSATAYMASFAHELVEIKAVLTHPAFDLDHRRFTQTLTYLESSIQEDQWLGERANGGKIIEGHGDLRPEHVWLNAPPAMIDCLEFNPRLRLIDPCDELTFLGLECQRLGADWIAPLLLQRYIDRSGDVLHPALISFYWIYRACLRARLCLVHLLEHDKRAPHKWLPLALEYLKLADLDAISCWIAQVQ